MKKMMINIITQIALGLALITIISCSSNNNNIQVEMPSELQNNAEVVTYINKITKTTNKASGLFNDIVKITGGKDINNSYELTTMQTLNMAKAAGQLMMASSKITEYKTQRTSIDSLLSPSQIIALDKVCKELESSMAQIDPSNITIDTTEMLAQQKIQKEQDAEIEEQCAQWEQAQIEQVQIEGREYIPETEKQENSEFV